jgi:prophage antirepressor-like protein
MSNLQIFNSTDFGNVRFIELDGRPYAVANDVAKVLGYKVPKDAIARHCKGALFHRHPGQSQDLKIIPEGDIYRLIIRSKLPTAERFESWVFDEVLPVLRQKGVYSIQQSNFIIPQTLPDALRLAADLYEQNQELLPKAKSYDKFLAATNVQSMNYVAKCLKTGRNRLFRFLRSQGILMRDNVPYQQYINLGYFTTRERTVYDGEQSFNTIQTLVTPKGVDFIGELLEN